MDNETLQGKYHRLAFSKMSDIYYAECPTCDHYWEVEGFTEEGEFTPNNPDDLNCEHCKIRTK